MSVLDLEQTKLEDDVKESKKIINAFIIQVGIKNFREKLKDYMENLVVSPLFNAFLTYKNLKNLKSENKKEIFEYILFREVFISAKIKGSETRQKLKASARSMGSSFHETNVIKQGRSKSGLTESTQDITPKEIEQFPDLFEDFMEGEE